MNKYPIPDDIFKTHLGIFGKTGAGKSVVLATIIERLYKLGRRVCVIDPKGDHWGLRYAGDGKNPGLPIYLFGDFKNPEVADVPLNPKLGKEMAKLVAESGASYVLGFRGWTVNDTTGFYIDFISTLYQKANYPLNLVIDEMQNFAPKGKILSPQAAMCIHWSNKMMSEGRGLGFSINIASLRPQKVHNDTLDCVETLVAMRSVHPRARQAISEWMDGHGDPEKSKEILNSLAGMKRGEAYVWSPENEFMSKVKFPMCSTYDSYKPPTDADRKLQLKARAEVDLEDVKKRFAVTIEEVKSNDPRELKKKVLELKKELDAEKKRKTGPAFMPNDKEVGLLQKQAKDALDAYMRVAVENAALRDMVKNAATALKSSVKLPPPVKAPKISEPVRALPPTVQRPPVVTTRQESSHGTNGELTNPEQRILDAIAWMESLGITEPKQPAVAFLADYTHGSGGYNNPRGSLRTKGLVEYVPGNRIKLTDEGRALANKPEAALTNDDLHKKVLGNLPGPEQKLLKELIAAYPNSMSNEDLAAATGYTSGGGGYNNPRGRLRSLGLIDYVGNGHVKAESLLFPEES